MNNEIIFKEFPGSYEQRYKKENKRKTIFIVFLILLIIILSVLSTLLNIKILNK